MPQLAPELFSGDQQVLYGFIVLAILFFPFVAAGLHAFHRSNQQRNEKHISDLSDDDMQQIGGARATGTVFFLLALFVVFLLTAWGGKMGQ